MLTPFKIILRNTLYSLYRLLSDRAQKPVRVYAFSKPLERQGSKIRRELNIR